MGDFQIELSHSVSHHFEILNSIRVTIVTKLWDFWTLSYYQSIQTGSKEQGKDLLDEDAKVWKWNKLIRDHKQ